MYFVRVWTTPHLLLSPLDMLVLGAECVIVAFVGLWIWFSFVEWLTKQPVKPPTHRCSRCHIFMEPFHDAWRCPQCTQTDSSGPPVPLCKCRACRKCRKSSTRTRRIA